MEEAGLLGQLGINWKLFLSQAVNFFILLLVLRAFVYKPLLVAIKKRTEKITEGLQKAKEADVRLAEVDVIAKGKLQEAEGKSVELIRSTEARAKVLEDSLKAQAEKKQQELLQKAREIYQKQQEENRELVLAQAGELVKKIVVKTVELNPKDVDNALIAKAIEAIKHED